MNPIENNDSSSIIENGKKYVNEGDVKFGEIFINFSVGGGRIDSGMPIFNMKYSFKLSQNKNAVRKHGRFFMGLSSIQHNMLMMNADRRMRENAKVKTKTAEKLASGYRINRAADDAAGLSISEKMRYMIRGLNQGTENATDGISWVQIGDGSLEEAHSMLHRMTELAIKSSNGTNTDDDRAMMQAEFAHLQKEIDRLTDNTTFNEQHIFQEHGHPYHQIEGSTQWSPTEYHQVREGENDLVVTYAKRPGDVLETVSIEVAAGTYTTKELIDEIDTALEKAGLLDEGLRFEYTQQGFCNLNLEGGMLVDEVSGGLSYLLYDHSNGGTLGALIGTTVFLTHNDGILVDDGENDIIHFKLLDPADPNEEEKEADKVELDLDGGKMYTKDQLIEMLKMQLDQKVNKDENGNYVEKVKVDHHGTAIMMYSEDYIISEFWGNMFHVDDDTNFTSIFYDNIHPVDHIDYAPAVFEGAPVLQVTKKYYSYDPTPDPYDQEASVFHFTEGVNDLLVLNPGGKGEITLNLTDLDGNGLSLDGKTMAQACNALNAELARRYGADAPVRFTAVEPGYNSANPSLSYSDYKRVWDEHKGTYVYVGYASMNIQTTKAVPGESVGIDKAKSTAYNTLFTRWNKSVQPNDALFGNETQADRNCTLTGGRVLSGGLNVTADNNAFHLAVGPGLEADIVLDQKNYNLGDLKAELQKKIDDAFKDTAPAHLKDAQGRVLVVSDTGGKIVLTGATDQAEWIRVSGVANNQGYEDIFPLEKIKPKRESETGTAAMIKLPEYAKCDADGKNVVIDSAYRYLKVSVDGKSWNNVKTLDLYANADAGNGKWSDLKALEDYITKELEPVVTDKGFTRISPEGKHDVVTMPSVMRGTGVTRPGNPEGYVQDGKSEWSAPQGQGGTLLSNSGAKVTIQKALTATTSKPLKITSDNNTFTFKKYMNRVNGNDGPSTSFSVSLTPGTEYTSLADLQKDLQDAINAANGNIDPESSGGIKVDIVDYGSGKTLAFTVGVKLANGSATLGERTRLVMDTSVGFLRDQHATKSQAGVTVGATEKKATAAYSQNRGVNDSFKPAENVSLNIKLGRPNAAGTDADYETVTVSLAANTEYTRATLKSAIETALTGKGVVVNYDSDNRLTLAYDQNHAGDHYNIEVDKDSTALKYMFGYKDNAYKTEYNYAASGEIGTSVEKEFTLASTDNRSFSIQVDGQTYEVTLDAGDYSTTDATKKNIADEIRNKVNAKAGKTVLSSNTRLKDGKIFLETESKNGPWNSAANTGSQIIVEYKSDSAMQKIFGAKQEAGATAKFVQDATGGYQLTLTRTLKAGVADPQQYASYRNIIVISNQVRDTNAEGYGTSTSYQGGSFIFPDSKDYEPEHDDGRHSQVYSYMQGRPLAAQNKLDANGKITINDQNNKLTFYFTDNYVSTTNPTPTKISIEVDEGKYTLDELKDHLQTKLDGVAGNTGKQVVKVQDGGIRIEAAGKGRSFRIYTKNDNWPPTGGFYRNVICSGSMQANSHDIKTNDPAKAIGGIVYAVGREDVKNKEVKIQKDGNDTLSLTFKFPGGPSNGLKLKMVLDPGYYRGDTLVKEIQIKLDLALEKEGLEKGLIEVGIGTVKNKTEIVGSINDRALTFKLSETVKGPGRGPYAIEAIGGTAAFSVFYATDGDIARAYVMGGKDISNGVEIKAGQNTLGFDVDGVSYSVDLTPGKYTAEGLINHINDKLKNDGGEQIPLKAYEDNGKLKLMHRKYGKHTINHLSGAIKNQLFFSEKALRVGNEPMRLRVSGSSGDWIEVDKPWMDTTSLGINTLTIEKYKNAQKAITRLKSAVTRVSEVRSYFGALQNRLESTVRNNENKAENTTAAESRIRDADISKEAVENSIHNILEQSGVSVMTQVMQNSKLALQLLS